MKKLPHEVERLGPELQAWVEHELLRDLKNYGIAGTNLTIDWSQVVQEGHWTKIEDRMLESLSDIGVRNHAGSLVAEGRMDFVLVSSDERTKPVLFWLFLDMERNGTMTRVKTDAFLPSHLWESLSELHRAYIASTESKWLKRDPKVQDWKRKTD